MKSSLIGRQLGDYTLVRVLATGGMSRIYEGLDRGLNRRAAIKVLDLEADPNDGDSLRMRFEREARALAKLEHPNIVRIYQYGEQDGLYFIAMKLIEGSDLAGELKELNRTGRLMSPARAIGILSQVAAALDTAHAAHIIHRDVKPSNILIDLQDHATLSDFGLVIEPSIDATFGTAFGTPRYISPEQATDSSQAVPQSDIYSFGVVAYEVLTGRTPFDGRSPMEIAISHISDPPPAPRTLNPNLPQAVEDALLRALQKEPHRRHETATAFINALHDGFAEAGLLADDTRSLARTTALPPVAPPPPPAPAPQRRSLWLWLAGGGALVAAALIVAALLITGAGSTNAVATPTPAAASVAVPTASIAPIVAPATIQAPTEPAPTVPAPTTTTALASPGVPELDITGLSLIYDNASLTLVNASDAEIVMRAVSLSRSGEANSVFSGESVPGGALPAGSCYRIRLQGQRAALPDACGGRLHGQLEPSDPAALFWVSQAFDVRANGVIVRGCPSSRDGGTC